MEEPSPKATVIYQRNLFIRNKKPIFLSLGFLAVVFLAAAVWRNFDFLGQKTKSGSKTAATVVACPVPADLCSKAKNLEVLASKGRQQSIGVGWKLPENSLIRAAFDGKLTFQSIFGGKQPPRIYLLTNSANTYQAAYVFVPERPFTQTEQEALLKGKPVKKGEVLATVPGITLDEMGYKDFNLHFYVVDLQRKERISTLTPQSLGKLSLP